MTINVKENTKAWAVEYQRDQRSALEETVDISIFILKHRIPITASKTVLMELKDTKAERMGCVTILKEQGHVPEVTVVTRSNCKYMHCSYSFRKERSFSNHRQMHDKTAFNLIPNTKQKRENWTKKIEYLL